jgi:hypothetical protein
MGQATVEIANLERVDWYNYRRPPEPVGNIRPAEAEAKHFAESEGHSVTAQNSMKPAPGKIRRRPRVLSPRARQ